MHIYFNRVQGFLSLFIPFRVYMHSILYNLYITGQMALSDNGESLNLTSESSEPTHTKNPWKAREIAAQMSRKALSETTGIPEVIFLQLTPTL